MCCPFCLGLGLPACVYLSGCWHRPRAGEVLVDEHGIVPGSGRPEGMTIEREHELLATILYYTRKQTSAE